MRVLFGANDVWEVVENGYEEPKSTDTMTVNQLKTLRETRTKDMTALHYLFQALDESDFEKISNATSQKRHMRNYESFKGADRVKQVRLQTRRGELESIQVKESESVFDYITRMKTVVNQLKRNDEDLTEIRSVEQTLRSLADHFHNIVCAIQESKDIATLTIDELTRSLVAHEQWKKKNKDNTLKEVLESKAII